MTQYFNASFADHPAHSLGGVALPVNVLWTDRQQEILVGQQLRRSLSGNIDVYEVAVTKGQPITLDVTLNGNSMLTQAKYDALKALASAVNTTYTLSWGAYNTISETWTNTNYTVIFRHSDAPVLDFQVIDHPAMAYDGGYYEGQIKLLTV